MVKKLNCILLVDDDRATNYVHEVIIKRLDCAERIVVKRNGEEALDFLIGENGNATTQPDLILLDINMPRMNGWEFLEAYGKLNTKHPPIIIAMLTSSLNPDDVNRAKEYNVRTFKNKPLTPETMLEILEESFGSDE